MKSETMFETMERRFNELRRELLGEGLHVHNGHWFSSPAVDLVEEGDSFVMTAELPGFDKKDVGIEVDEEGVHVSATRTSEKDVRHRKYVRQERHSESFERYVEFPSPVSPEGAKATFRNGILEITVPKSGATQRSPRRVDVE